MRVFGFPVCFHKHGECWDITRVKDPVRVFLCPCGGVRTAHPEPPH